MAFDFRYVVYQLGTNKMFAVVRDPGGVSRKVSVSWYQKPKDQGDLVVPPSHWVESVYGELEYQRSQRHAGSIQDQFARAQRRSK